MKEHIQNFIKYKDLLIELIIKDIKLKYRNSVLGVLWSLLNPLLIMVVLTIVFSALFKNNIEHFPLYVLIGRILYSFFSEDTNFAMDSVYTNGSLIRKVYVPKYFFPLARVCSSFVTMLISLVLIFGAMAVSGVPFSPVNLLIVFPLFYLFLTALGIGLLLATICVFFRDLKHLYSVILMVVMYMTPIFYPASIIPEQYRPIVELNPLFPIVEMFRDLTMYHTLPSVGTHLIALAHGAAYVLIGLFVFYKKQDRFIFHL